MQWMQAGRSDGRMSSMGIPRCTRREELAPLSSRHAGLALRDGGAFFCCGDHLRLCVGEGGVSDVVAVAPSAATIVVVV